MKTQSMYLHNNKPGEGYVYMTYLTHRPEPSWEGDEARPVNVVEKETGLVTHPIVGLIDGDEDDWYVIL